MNDGTQHSETGIGGDRTVRVVQRLIRVPSRYRRFEIPAEDVERVHRFDPALIERLLDLGLPHGGSASARRFDLLDVENIGIELQLPCPRWNAMRWWSRALPTQVVPGPRTLDLTLGADCPTPREEHDCEVVLYPGTVQRGQPDRVVARPPADYRLSLTTEWIVHHFEEPFSPLIAEVLPLIYHRLPQQLTTDLGFVRETGLANCRVASDFLIDAAARRELPVRPSAGLFLASPFAVRHWWVEFLDRGRWLAADPFLLNAFARWGVVDPAVWPANRSPSGVLWELADPADPIASHCGDRLKVTKMLSTSGPRSDAGAADAPSSHGAGPRPTTLLPIDSSRPAS